MCSGFRKDQNLLSWSFWIVIFPKWDILSTNTQECKMYNVMIMKTVKWSCTHDTEQCKLYFKIKNLLSKYWAQWWIEKYMLYTKLRYQENLDCTTQIHYKLSEKNKYFSVIVAARQLSISHFLKSFVLGSWNTEPKMRHGKWWRIQGMRCTINF